MNQGIRYKEKQNVPPLGSAGHEISEWVIKKAGPTEALLLSMLKVRSAIDE